MTVVMGDFPRKSAQLTLWRYLCSTAVFLSSMPRCRAASTLGWPPLLEQEPRKLPDSALYGRTKKPIGRNCANSF